jgi:hypothetical protein
LQPLKTEPKPQVEEARFLDPRIGQRGAVRNKRALAFHEAGKFQAEAQRLRMKVFFNRFLLLMNVKYLEKGLLNKDSHTESSVS